MQDVIDFLKLNGFIEVGDGVYRNNHCAIEVWSDYYAVLFDDGAMYSNDLSIYWLIGVLTYYGLMDKNYQSPHSNS